MHEFIKPFVFAFILGYAYLHGTAVVVGAQKEIVINASSLEKEVFTKEKKRARFAGKGWWTGPSSPTN